MHISPMKYKYYLKVVRRYDNQLLANGINETKHPV